MADNEMDHTEEDLALNPLEKLRKSFRHEMKELVDLELDVEELAERKADIIKAYLKEDVHGVKEYWEDLKAEAHTLEDYIGEWLLKAANPAAVDWLKLQEFIANGDDQVVAGNTVTDVTLECMGCGKLHVIEGSHEVLPCSNCDCQIYRYR